MNNAPIVDITQVRKGAKVKGMNMGGDGFGMIMDAAMALAPVGGAINNAYGNSIGATALASAFSGMQAGAGAMGGGGMSYASGGISPAPMMAAGFGGGKGMGMPNAEQPLFPGTGDTGMSQMDMVNTMNQNNLQLLELQAVMQNNMQGWNTKSNILSADHRARMTMIEKFTVR